MSWLLLAGCVQLCGFVIGVRAGVSFSRRLLAATLGLLVPAAGPLLAWVVRSTRGGGCALGPEEARLHTRRISAGEVRRQAELPPLLERLMSTDPAERLSALVAVSSLDDALAIALLRWTMERGSAEVVLDAALTLESLDLRREERLERARRELAGQADFESALAAGDAAASGVLSGMADIASVPALAREARAAYELAVTLSPGRAHDVEERLVRLELAASRPEAALEVITRLAGRVSGEAALRVRALRNQAAFAARRFELILLSSRDCGGHGAHVAA